jgi:hypothetical protein
VFRLGAEFWHTRNPSMIRWRFHPRTRNPLARLLAVVIGAAALVVVVAFGLFAAAALVVGGAVALLVRSLMRSSPNAAPRTSARPATAGGVIEGEFKVVEDARARAR